MPEFIHLHNHSHFSLLDGAATIDGLQMLIHQATAQFELWTGLPAPLEIMSRAAYAALK